MEDQNNDDHCSKKSMKSNKTLYIPGQKHIELVSCLSGDSGFQQDTPDKLTALLFQNSILVHTVRTNTKLNFSQLKVIQLINQLLKDT